MIRGLDHLVLTVRDIGATERFYQALGMSVQSFKGGRKALHFGRQKINLHEAGREFEPKAMEPRPGSADLCFLIEVPLAEAMRRLDQAGIAIIEGPVERAGAQGPIRSIYCRDPDGNLIELAEQVIS